MKKLIKPASIAFYLLMLIVFFMAGLYFAAAIDAGKNQGLAGGAIVLGYGVLFGGAAFLSSFFLAYHVAHKWIVRFNWILLGLALLAYGITHYRFLQRKKSNQLPPKEVKPTSPTTVPFSLYPNSLRTTTLVANVPEVLNNNFKTDPIGLGFFIPNFYTHPSCHLYGNISWEKGAMEHVPQDSIVLQRNEVGNFDLQYAPPYLLPEYHQTTHGIFYFKVLAEGFDFVKVAVNNKTKQSAYINKNHGRLLYWPAFLLQLSEVRLNPDHVQPLRLKPLAHAAIVSNSTQKMKPLAVQQNWMLVAQVNNNGQLLDRGWIQWRKGHKQLIDYTFSSF